MDRLSNTAVAVNSYEQLNLFQERLPTKPWCSNDLSAYGLKIRNQAHALKHTHIQYNPPPAVAWLVFDIDRPGAQNDWYDQGLPPPAWISTNPENGHCHIAYGIKTPVTRTNSARIEPLRLLAAIEKAYRVELGGDPRFTSFITKNPLHKHWITWTPVIGGGVYELNELAEYVDLSVKADKRTREEKQSAEYGLSRNVTMFDDLRFWAYSSVREFWSAGGYDRWLTAVEAKAQGINENQFPNNPLPLSEVVATGKSVAKWVWRNITPTSFRDYVNATHTPEIQSKRGKIGGKKSGQVRGLKALEAAGKARKLKAEGLTQKEISEKLGISLRTVKTYTNRKGATKPISDNSR
jgi:hypothetical protein